MIILVDFTARKPDIDIIPLTWSKSSKSPYQAINLVIQCYGVFSHAIRSFVVVVFLFIFYFVKLYLFTKHSVTR